MASFEITSNQHAALTALLKMPDVSLYLDHEVALQEVLAELEQVHFPTRTCPVCEAVFEAENPRKKTCSDACRQALSRSKCDPMAILKRKSTLKRQALLEEVYNLKNKKS